MVHGIDGSHESGVLVGRISVCDDVFKLHCRLAVAAGVEPVGESSAVEVSSCYAFVAEEQRDKLLHVLSHEVTFGIDDERLIPEERRREIDFRVLAEEPPFHFVVCPSFCDVDGGESLDNHLHSVRQRVDAR